MPSRGPRVKAEKPRDARRTLIRTLQPRDARRTLIRTLRYMVNYRFLVLFLLACTFASNIGNLLGPSFAGKAIGAAVGPGQVDFATVAHYAKYMLAAYLISNIMSFLVNQGMMLTGRRVANQMRRDVFNKLMVLPVSYFDRNQAGDIISRVSYETVILFVTVPLAVCFTRYMGKRTRPLYSRRSAAYGEMNGYVEEMFSGQKTILAYAYENDVCEEFSGINHKAADAYCAADTVGMTTGPTVNLINNLGLSLIGLLGAVLYMFGLTGMEQISAFVLYSRKFSGPINEIANIINEIYSALAAAERVFTLLDQPEEPADLPDAEVLSDVKGKVEAEHVSFGYLPGRTILHDLSLRAEPGQTVAIVGHTGAGKTTIINLLMRRSSLRRAYAMVLQDTWVFQGTIFDNIAYGKEGATREEVVAAAKTARIHEYIMRLPDGYDTVISEDGGNISKGQKQLLTIARAMLYDTQMLILDEATSNVDTNTEQKVQKAMQELMRGKTSFVIAHRLSTIQNADKILVMEHGDVMEQGTHQELMAKKGLYYKLYASQFE